MKQNKFSVIIPIYNSQKYLNECLNSVINQTYRNLEIILINDGSKDNSLKIMQKFGKEDSRITIVNKKNAGVSAARNSGIAKASGDYVMFVDSDDYFMDMRAIEKLYVATIKECDVIIYNTFYETKRITYSLLGKSYIYKKEFDDFLFYIIKNEHINSPFNKVYKRQTISKYNIQFDDNIRIGEDLLFNIAYFKHCKSVYYLNKTLYFYRTSNTNSATSAYMKNKYTDLMAVNDAMYIWLKQRENDKLTNVSLFIRIKNILSCIKDLHHKNCPMTQAEKKKTVEYYKQDNHRIIIKGCGVKIYIISLIYSFLNANTLYGLTSILVMRNIK